MQIMKIITNNKYFIFLITFSLLTRFYYSFTHIDFSQDLARDLLILEEYKEKGVLFIPYGPKTSVGNFFVPPFYYQLHYFLSFLTNSPYAMKALCTLIESFTVLVLFFILKKFFNTKIAFLSALFYSTFNLPIIFGTNDWNPTLIPFFSSLSLYFWLNYIFEEKNKSLIFALISTSIIFHLHFQASFLILFILIVFIWSLFKGKLRIKYWIIGGTLSLLFLLPYIFAEIKNNFTNSKSLFNFITKESPQYFDRVSKPDYLFNYYPIFIEKVIFNKTYNFYPVGKLFFFLGISIFLFYSFKRKNYKIRWLFIYFLSIFIMVRVYKGDKIEYYLSTLYIFPSFLISLLMSIRNKVFNVILVLYIIVISFFAGKNLASNKQYNSLETLRLSILELDETVKKDKVRIVFHDDDFVNIFAYGLKHYSDISLDLDGITIVDICNQADLCSWNQENFSPYVCQNNIIYTYSSHLKYFADSYEFIKEIKSKYSDYRISISRVSNIADFKYNDIKQKYDYGNDFLLKEAIY